MKLKTGKMPANKKSIKYQRKRNSVKNAVTIPVFKGQLLLFQVVLRYGDMVGTRGADIISVDIKSNEVTLWDNKYRTANTPIKDSPTFKDDPKRLGNAKNQALRTIEESNLPRSQKDIMKNNVEKGNFTTVTVGDGNARNSVISIYRDGACINCGS